MSITPIIWILVGTLMIAAGGLAATYGWNLHSDLARRDALLKAMAAETMINLNVVNDKTVQTPGNQFVMLPRVQHVALDGAIGAGLFTSTSDRELLTHLSGLRELLVSLNDAFEFTEAKMARDPASILNFRTKMSEGKTLKQVRERIVEFGRFLIKKGYVDETYVPFSP